MKLTKNYKRNYLLISIVAVFVFLLSLCVGRFTVPIADVFDILTSKLFNHETDVDPMKFSVVYNLRLPRALMAAIVGASLALTGSTYQGIFKNPLVSPDLLGVSAGACVGAALAILNDLSSLFIQLFSFAGAIIAVCISTALPKFFKNSSTMMLVLSGIITGSFMNALIGLLKFLADTDEKLASITFWTMGSLAQTRYEDIRGIFIPVVICCAILISLRWRINIMSLGDAEAESLGINVKMTRSVIILCSTLITACVVSVSGTIGWVGLVIPHFSRLIIGHDNTKVLPFSTLLGAVLMMIVDTVARTISPSDLPLSIVTSFIGAPFYTWLLYRQEVKVR